MTVYEMFKKNPVCAILRNIPDDRIVLYAQTAYQAGIRLFEVAMNTKNAAAQIGLLKSRLPKDGVVGAGTVLSLSDCQSAYSAGAQFFLTPSASVRTMEFCVENEIPLIPGVMTPSDVALCVSHGFHLLKLFPAGCMPPGYVKSLRGPFDGTEYIAVGGVSPENMGEFFRQGYVGVGIGSNLIPKKMADEGRWDDAENYLSGWMGTL